MSTSFIEIIKSHVPLIAACIIGTFVIGMIVWAFWRVKKALFSHSNEEEVR